MSPKNTKQNFTGVEGIVYFWRTLKSKPGYLLALELFLIVGIFAVAIILRIWQIDKIPGGVYADVAANGLDGLAILDGDIRAFYTRNAGRESLFLLIIASWQLFTKSYVAMYLASASVGIATVVVHYFVSRQIWGRKISIFASALLATNFFHLHYSRLGYRVILMPLFILILTYFLWKLQKTWRYRWAGLFGITLGLAAYTYLSFRTLLIAAILTYVVYYIQNRHNQQILAKFNKIGLILFGGAIVVSIPLLIELIQNPQFILGRSGDVLRLADIPKNVLQTISVFGFGGDPEFQYNIPGRPIVSLIWGIFLIPGFWIILKKWQQPLYLFVFLAFWSQLGIVAITDRVPHMLRAVGISGLLFIIIAIGIRTVWRWLLKEFKLKKSMSLVLLVTVTLATLVTAYIDTHTYFVRWANQDNLTRSEFFTDYITLADYLQSQEFMLIKTRQENPTFSPYIVSTYYREGEPELNYYQLQTTDYILQYPENPPYRLLYLNTLESAPGIYLLKTDDERSEQRFLELNPEAQLVDKVLNSYELENPETYRVYFVDDTSNQT